jgi:hypothetical protein
MGHDHERAELSRLRRRQVHAVDRQIATSLDERRKQRRVTASRPRPGNHS